MIMQGAQCDAQTEWTSRTGPKQEPDQPAVGRRMPDGDSAAPHNDDLYRNLIKRLALKYGLDYSANGLSHPRGARGVFSLHLGEMQP